jgi:hemolysin activation/secretion protein
MKRLTSRHLATPLSLLAWLALQPAVSAWAAGPIAPGAGSLLQQQLQGETPSAAPSNDTGLKIEQPAAGALPDSPALLVQRIEIDGNVKIAKPVLLALVADAQGKSMTLPQLGELAARITAYYHTHGYPLSRAIIPAQSIEGGVVRIQVIEARYGTITLDNQSPINAGLLHATLGGLQSGMVVTQAEMERSLLLLSDLAGVAVTATLRPGSTSGTTDLQVHVAPAQTVAGAVSVDNYGNRYTGRIRMGALAELGDPLHIGDTLSLSTETSGSQMNYGRVAYEAPVDGVGTRVGVSYSALDYRLGGPFSVLQAHGNAQVSSLWLAQTFVRSSGLNLYGQIQYDHMQLRDEIGASAIQTNRHLDTATASLLGNERDGLLAGATTTWNSSWTYGQVHYDNPDALASDAAGAQTQGGFSKWNVSATRLQSLGPRDALYLSAAGQWSSTNLDPAQKMIAGGPYTVRAYDIGVLSGDTGYFLSAELRHTWQTMRLGQWQTIAFFDTEHITLNRHAFVPGANNATLSGIGVGLNWIGPAQLSASIYVAGPVGSTPVQIGSTASARVWGQLNKGFR